MIRLGIIGCGGMSAGWAAAARENSARVEVSAVIDIAPGRLEPVARQFPRARATDDYRQALDDTDAALLILPHHLHHPVAMDLLRAGKHVLVEKPMANTESQCLEMIEAAERGGRVLMVGYVLRYHPLFLRLKELVDSGRFGDLFHLSMWTEQLTVISPDSWIADAEKLGGGQLFSHGCHYIDLLLWFLGEPVEGTHIGTNYGTPWMAKEGTSDVSIRFASGAIGYHMGTWGAVGTRHGYAFHAICTKGTLEADFLKGTIHLHCPNAQTMLEAGAESDLPQPELPHQALIYQAPTGKNVQYELGHFLDCIETGATPVTNGRDSLQGLRVIWRLYEAGRQGRVADLRGLGLGLRR